MSMFNIIMLESIFVKYCTLENGKHETYENDSDIFYLSAWK